MSLFSYLHYLWCQFFASSLDASLQVINTSTIARGIAVGDELEYADEVTLGRSILNRIPFEGSLKAN